MIIAVLIIAVVLLAVLERYSASEGLRQLEEDHELSSPTAEPDENTELILRLINHSRWFLPFVRFRERLPEGIVAAGSEETELDYWEQTWLRGTTWLRPRQILEKKIAIRGTRRGRFLFSSLQVSIGDFLGMDDETRSFDGIRELIVFPKELPMEKLQPVLGGFLGDRSVRRFIFEDPVLTLGFREYTGREPMKMISWKQSARQGELMVKHYDYTMEPSVLVLLNTEYEAEDREAVLETCFMAARTVCQMLEKQNIPYDFAMNAVMLGSLQTYCYIPEGLGSGHLFGVLESLGRASYQTVCSCRRLLRQNLEGRSGKGVLFITPERNEEYRHAEQLLQGEMGCLMTGIIARELM